MREWNKKIPEKEVTHISAKNMCLPGSFSDTCPFSYYMIHEEQKEQPAKLSYLQTDLKTSYLPIFFVENLERSHLTWTWPLQLELRESTDIMPVLLGIFLWVGDFQVFHILFKERTHSKLASKVY